MKLALKLFGALCVISAILGAFFSASNPRRIDGNSNRGLPEKPFTWLFDKPIFGTIEEGFPFTGEMFDTLKETVKRTLKDPGSASFANLYAVGDRKVSNNKYASVLCGHVNAKMRLADIREKNRSSLS
jgi:hypothetical protein